MAMFEASKHSVFTESDTYQVSRHFFMPHHSDNLCNILKKPAFRNNPNLFKMIIGWVRDLIAGVKNMHGYGVSHLDIKCDNILITSDLKAVLCDFSVLIESKAWTYY